MSDADGRDTRQDSTAQDFYRVLYVAPSAPQDLIVELYWHLVRHTHDSDQDADERLRELNEAYGAILHAEQAARDRPHAGLSSFAPAQEAPRSNGRSPWKLLHLHPEAPPHVIDVAYKFWRLRARGEAPEQLTQLDAAYRDLAGQSESPPLEAAPPETEAADRSSEGREGRPRRLNASAAALAVALSCMRWLASATGSLARWLAPRLRRAGHRGLTLLGVAALWCLRTTADGIRRATPIVAQGIRALARELGSALRAAVTKRAPRSRPITVTSTRRTDTRATPAPRSPNRPARPQQPADIKPDPSVEERFAALASDDSTALLADQKC